MRYFLRKDHKLVSEKEINSLFSEGKSNFIFPIKLLYSVQQVDRDNFKFMVAVPKRYHKRAVARNRIKRIIRETLRLNQHDFIPYLVEKRVSLRVAFIYLSTSIVSSAELDRVIKLHIGHLLNRIEINHESIP